MSHASANASSVCPTTNKQAIDQSTFWNSGDLNWDTHRIGWAIAGACAAATFLISLVTVIRHCRNYTNPREQRQILRIIYMPPVYAIISFFSYRFFRKFTYYELVEVAYEAITLSAFLLLLIEFVARTASGGNAMHALERKDKRPLPFPFCMWRYRPTKAYFMYTLKWSVLQYIIIRPLASIVGIICEHYHVLCEAAGFNIHFANVYLEAIDFVSISIALYGLLTFYGLTAEELKGRRPLAKFLCIKLIVMFTFYQSFVFKALESHGVIKETDYWTATNITDGLSALAICIEMVFFAVFMMFAYPPSEYLRKSGAPPTRVWKPLWDSINYSDFAQETYTSLQYFFARQPARAHAGVAGKMNFAEAFGVSTARGAPYVVSQVRQPLSGYEGGSMAGGPGGAGARAVSPGGVGARPSYDEHIRLAPYPTTRSAESVKDSREGV